MKVRIDTNACTGHGRCYVLAPDVFEPDDEGHSVARIEGDLPAELEAQALKGQSNCPENAITCS